jgi:tetratricopeptide (TPR) repeat protein
MLQRLIACLLIGSLAAPCAFSAASAEAGADSTLQRANEEYELGHLKKAIELFETIVGKPLPLPAFDGPQMGKWPTYSGYWSVMYNLAVAYYQDERFDEAIGTFKKILEKCQDAQMKEECTLLLASAMSAQVCSKMDMAAPLAEKTKLFAPVLAQFDAYISKYGTKDGQPSRSLPDALYGKATAQYMADDLEGAEKTVLEFLKLPNRSTFEVEAKFLQAKVYASQGRKLLDDRKNPNAKAEARKRFDDAENLFTEISKNQASLALANDARRSAGEILIKAEEYGRALKYLRQVLPNAMLVDQQQDYVDKIKKMYNQAMLKNASEANEVKKQLDRERRRLDGLRSRNSTFLISQLLVMQCDLNLKRYDEALILSGRFYPFLDPEQKKACNYFTIMALINKKDLEKAIAKYTEFKGLYPKDKVAEGVPGAIAGMFADLGKHADAIKWAEEYYAEYGKDPSKEIDEKMLFMLSGSYLAWGNAESDPTKKAELLKKAQEWNDIFSKKYPDSILVPMAEFGKAYGLYGQGNYKDAAEDFRKYIAKYSKNPKVENIHIAHFVLILCLNSQKKADEVIKECETFETAYPNSEWRLRVALMKGETADYMKKDYDKAIKAYDHVVKDYMKGNEKADEISRAQYNIGMCYFKWGKRTEGITALKRFIELFPDHSLTSNCYLIIAEELKNDNKFDDAAKAYQDIVAKYPNSESAAEAWLAIGIMQVDRASKMAANPSKLPAEKQAQWKEVMLKGREAFEEVVKNYFKFATVDKALSRLSNWWQVTVFAGESFGTKDQAIQYFQKLASEASEAAIQVKISFTQGSLLALIGDKEAALKALGEAFEKAKNGNISLPNSGYEEYRDALCNSEKFDEAIAVSERQLEEKKQANDQKGTVEAILGLCRAFFDKGDSAKALEYANKVINEFQWDQEAVPEAMRYIGWIDEKNKKYADAIKQYNLILPKLQLSNTVARLKVFLRLGYAFYGKSTTETNKTESLNQAIAYFLQLGYNFSTYPKYAAEGLYMGGQIAETGIAIQEKADPKTRRPVKYFAKEDAIKFYQMLLKSHGSVQPWADKARERLKALGAGTAPAPTAPAPKR